MARWVLNAPECKLPLWKGHSISYCGSGTMLGTEDITEQKTNVVSGLIAPVQWGGRKQVRQTDSKWEIKMSLRTEQMSDASEGRCGRGVGESVVQGWAR